MSCFSFPAALSSSFTRFSAECSLLVAPTLDVPLRLHADNHTDGLSLLFLDSRALVASIKLP